MILIIGRLGQGNKQLHYKKEYRDVLIWFTVVGHTLLSSEYVTHSQDLPVYKQVCTPETEAPPEDRHGHHNCYLSGVT